MDIVEKLKTRFGHQIVQPDALSREAAKEIIELRIALQTSTELLRDMFESYITQPKFAAQIAANEALLKEGAR